MLTLSIVFISFIYFSLAVPLDESIKITVNKRGRNTHELCQVPPTYSLAETDNELNLTIYIRVSTPNITTRTPTTTTTTRAPTTTTTTTRAPTTTTTTTIAPTTTTTTTRAPTTTTTTTRAPTTTTTTTRAPTTTTTTTRAPTTTTTTRAPTTTTTTRAPTNTTTTIDRSVVLQPITSLRWFVGRVPYVISSDFTVAVKNKILEAMREIEYDVNEDDNDCIHFHPRTTETNYSYIYPGNDCSSVTGRLNNGQNNVSLGPHCQVRYIILRELMHVLGFEHENSRFDRDRYVVVNQSHFNTDTSHIMKPIIIFNCDFTHLRCNLQHAINMEFNWRVMQGASNTGPLTGNTNGRDPYYIASSTGANHTATVETGFLSVSDFCVDFYVYQRGPSSYLTLKILDMVNEDIVSPTSYQGRYSDTWKHIHQAYTLTDVDLLQVQFKAHLTNGSVAIDDINIYIGPCK